MKFDLGMYISTVAPDPGYLTNILTCDQVPSEANGNQGQNSTGWCNEEATDQLIAADAELDETKVNYPGLYPGVVRLARSTTAGAIQFECLLQPLLSLPGFALLHLDLGEQQ